MRIAVLALQGAFIEHEQMLSRLGVSSMEIRKKEDLEQSFDGLIIPGGESTVQGKLMYELGLSEPLKKRITEGFPVFGTCAGLFCLRKQYKTMIGCILRQWILRRCEMRTGDSLAVFTRKRRFRASGKSL